jgi:hypothetical protein
LTVFTLFPAVVCAQPQSNAAAPKDQNAPEHFDSQASRSNRGNETLSDRLDRTDGVIRPPARVDPEIHEAPPPTGDKDIVIPAPPPGSNPAPK